MRNLLIAALATAAAIAAPASATVVDFNGLAFDGNTTHLETGGFGFNSSYTAQYFYYPGQGGVNNGTDYYMYNFGNTTISRLDGSAFKLNSADFGTAFSPANNTVNYLLNLASGGTQTGSFVTTGQFQTIAFGQSITSMVLFNAGDYIALDNLNYSAADADVPEPAMLGLFGLGAIGLGLSRRRKAA